MICFKTLDDIKIMCRICLIQSESVISLDDTIETPEGNLLLSDALKDILTVKINKHKDFPRGICNLCYGNIKILFDVKHLFTKSQRILEKYIGTLESEEYISLFKPTSIDQDTDYSSDHESSKMSVKSFCEDDDFTLDEPSVSNITEGADDNDLQDDTTNQESDVRSEDEQDNIVSNVKWVEGNKFVVQKSIRVPKTLQQCTYCNKRFLTEEKLTAHLTACSRYLVVKCDFCSRRFPSKEKKNVHINQRHNTNLPQLRCDICDLTFKNHNARSYHNLTRHNKEGKKFKCEICGKAFYIKNSLNQHMECHSRDVSRVVCPICGKGFHYRGGLFYHMKIHKNERNYICSFCKRRFLTMASLKRHTRIHTGERPYSCSLCSKSFCSVGEVKTHERRHTGQKPHPCKYCNKSFISPYNLKLHISSHGGSVACNLCPKSFLNTEALKYHLDIKHFIRDKKETIEVVV